MATHCLQHLAQGRLPHQFAACVRLLSHGWTDVGHLTKRTIRIKEKEKKTKREAQRGDVQRLRAEERRLRKKTRQRKRRTRRCKRKRTATEEGMKEGEYGEGQAHKGEDKSLLWTVSSSSYIQISKASLQSHIFLLTPIVRFLTLSRARRRFYV